MSEKAIVLEKVSKTFPKMKKPSVYETSITIEEGSFITILGTSGSGKTTLLKMINRIYELSSGRIFVQGEDVTQIPVTTLRRKIGYVIQQIGLFPHKTVEENIATVPRVLGWNKKDIDERIDFLLQLVQLNADFRKRYPRQLSGGQQQRIGIARAMAGDPAIMLMDEPFGAIDAITRSSLQDELIRIQKKLRKTILFVTHDIEEALKLGDRIIVMHDGRIQQFDTPLNVLTKPANAFVEKLVNSDDILQRLNLIKVESMMIPLEGQPLPGEKTVNRANSVKEVLTTILKSAVNSVIVEDDQKIPVGRVTLDQLKMMNETEQIQSASV